MPKTRPPYPEEFRTNAVKLLRSSGKTIPALARDLGCSTESLRNWTKQADLDRGRRTDGLTSDEREEFGKLRRQVKVLEEERAILLKAAAFFATETGRTR
ncbi:MAG: transposase [Solirubrobacteraceae bacterium]